MTQAPAYRIRAYRPGDESAILATFNRVFARVDPTFRPRTLEEWRWLYERNPSGLRIQLAIDDDGRVLAQYAGIAQRMLVEGEPTHFSHSVDSMSDPEFRKLSREPLFVQAGRAYEEAYGGTGPEKDTVMWGFPVPVAFRIGRKQLKYELIRQQHKLTLALARAAIPASPLAADELADFPAEIDALFARLARERGAIAVRDRAHFSWRYRENPNHRYRVGAVRRADRALAGVAVYRKGGFDLCEDGLLVDWLAPAADADVRAALLAWAADAARAEDCERLTALFPDTAPEWLALQRAGFRVRSTRYFLAGHSFSPRHDLDWMRRHWFYTLGDTDLA